MHLTVPLNFPLREWFSPSTLWVRLGIGLAIFAILALRDLQLHGRQARRWREYAFLAAVVLVAMTFGAVNDQISSRISWEYFYYGKELANILGPDTPPASGPLHWQAALVGVKATWAVGLLLGVALLIANNPRRGRPPLSFRQLGRFVPPILCATVAAAMIFAAAGWFGCLDWGSSDFAEMKATHLWRPRHFVACWGEHLGAYVGGAVGGIAATMRVFFRSKVTDST